MPWYYVLTTCVASNTHIKAHNTQLEHIIDPLGHCRTPSSLPALEHLTIPVAMIGAGRNGDCIPKRSNYNSFHTAAATAGAAPVLLAVAREAGHLQFLDSQTTLQR